MISLEKYHEFVGQYLPVLVEGYGEGLSLGRSCRDAPKVDGMIIISDQPPIIEIVPVVIDSALTYNMTGTSSRSDLVIQVRL